MKRLETSMTGGMEGGGRAASNHPLSNEIRDFVKFCLMIDGSITIPDVNCLLMLREMRGAKTEMTGKWNLLLLFSCPMSLGWARGRRLALLLLSTSSIEKIEPSGINAIPTLLILCTVAKECHDHIYTAWISSNAAASCVCVSLSEIHEPNRGQGIGFPAVLSLLVLIGLIHISGEYFGYQPPVSNVT